MSSDNGKDLKEAMDEEPKELVMTIKMSQTGSVAVQGPGDGKCYNEPMCFHMMRKAGQVIEQVNAAATKSPIIAPPKGGIMNFVRRKH